MNEWKRSVNLTIENFEALADLIASYPSITRSTHFVFVPGPLDMTSNSVFPRRPLLSTLTARLKSKLPRVHFGSNPCRIKYFGQEIVIIRENLMARMLRNLVGVKPRVREEDLKRYVCSHFMRCISPSNMIVVGAIPAGPKSFTPFHSSSPTYRVHLRPHLAIVSFAHCGGCNIVEVRTRLNPAAGSASRPIR
jgi:hypothetical protein